MTIKPRTIDNLGMEASVQYAENQKQYDARMMEESRLIPSKSAVPSVKPYAPSEFDQYFSIGKGQSWAIFQPPPDFYIYGESIFSHQLIPSLGSQEKQEADAEKLEHIEDYLSKEEKRGKKRESEDEHDSEERERETLIAMFQCLNKLDKVLVLINSRRNQYQRG